MKEDIITLAVLIIMTAFTFVGVANGWFNEEPDGGCDLGYYNYASDYSDMCN
jgi:hypothetical protein